MPDEWNPGSKYQTLLRRIQEIMDPDEPRTVRDIYYALESRGHEYEYRTIKRAVKKGRRHGYIDPDLIHDTSRKAEYTQYSGYTDPETFVANELAGIEGKYIENFWDRQPNYVEVWLEKQSLASVFEPICRRHNVRLEATRGDWSDSKVHQATQRLGKKVNEGKDVKVLYYGDFNPSGFHAPVSTQERMGYYGIELPREFDGEYFFDIWPFTRQSEFENTEGTIEFERCGINLEHIKMFELPENPNPSSTDKDVGLLERFMESVSEGRDVNIELNALKEYHREFLEDLIEESITKHIDTRRRAEVEYEIAQKRERIGEAYEIDWERL